MRDESRSPILAGMNDLEPQAARQPFWGPNAKMMAFQIVFGSALSYFVGWIILGGPNGWFGNWFANTICYYLPVGTC